MGFRDRLSESVKIRRSLQETRRQILLVESVEVDRTEPLVGHVDKVVARYGADMADTSVLYDRTDHVVTITYNRPEVMNAINGEMRRALNDAFARFRDDEEAWVADRDRSGARFLRRSRPARRSGPRASSRAASGRSRP